MPNMSSDSQFQPFFVDRAKGGRAACKLCKDKCLNGELRLAKVVPSPYGDNQHMKSWHHIDCFMNALLKQRPNTKRIDSIDDIANWDQLSLDDQEFLLEKINKTEELFAEKNSGKYTAKIIQNISKSVAQKSTEPDAKESFDVTYKDNSFSQFIKVCRKISKVDAYTDKTAVVNEFFQKGTDGSSFKGDLELWCTMLLPQVSKRVYNLKSKQLVKLFSRIFKTDQDDMLTHLEKGDVAATIEYYFGISKSFNPLEKSTITLQRVEAFLSHLSTLTKEEEQINHFKTIIKHCSLDDLRMIIRLIKHDLRINAGPKHILDGVHPNAYTIFQASRDLSMVISRVYDEGVKHRDSTQKKIKAELTLMTPVLPMLAEACKSVEMAMKKCPNGMYSEIKYDGERVQVHKNGREFRYFSRALKPVMSHKVSHFKDYLPKAFPEGEDLILDAEVLMVDVNTGKPLPFGSLGVHKQTEFKDAQVCLFVFDCIYYNGESLISLPVYKRRKILESHMKEIRNHVMLSEQELIRKPADLAKMIAKVLKLGLEGLVLKDLESKYEPGKRHWLKVKKDYLFDGAMADTADLVVLGAWFGTGKKGGMMSVFLMGCYDTARKKWVTVTKVHGGHDDSTLERLQKELGPLMVKISQEYNRIPTWLNCNKGMVPDFVAKDPKEQPVWEITGTEFTKANIHTADGISVRFPRVTKIRTDKNWNTATNLEELRHLYKTSKEKTDVTLLSKLAEASDEIDEKNEEPLFKKFKASPRKGTLDDFVKKKPKVKTKSSDSSFNTDDELTNIYASLSNESNNTNIKIETEVDSKIKSKKRKSEDVGEDKKKKIKVSPSSSIDKKESRHKGDNSFEPVDDLEMIDRKEKSRKVEETADNRKRKPYSDVEMTRKIIKTDSKVKLEEQSDNESVSSDKSTSHLVNKMIMPENPLPDLFINKKLGFYPDFISFPEHTRAFVERHWIAYGGTVNKSIKSRDIDYLLHLNNEINYNTHKKLAAKLPNAKHVHVKWFYMCLKKMVLCDTRQFPIIIKSNT